MLQTDEPGRPALKTARLNVNQTRLAPTTTSSSIGVKPATTATTRTPNRAAKIDCKCRPEEFTCASSSGSSSPTNNSRRKGQLSFAVKVVLVSFSSSRRLEWCFLISLSWELNDWLPDRDRTWLDSQKSLIFESTPKSFLLSHHFSSSKMAVHSLSVRLSFYR